MAHEGVMQVATQDGEKMGDHEQVIAEKRAKSESDNPRVQTSVSKGKAKPTCVWIVHGRTKRSPIRTLSHFKGVTHPQAHNPRGCVKPIRNLTVGIPLLRPGGINWRCTTPLHPSRSPPVATAPMPPDPGRCIARALDLEKETHVATVFTSKNQACLFAIAQMRAGEGHVLRGALLYAIA